MKLLIAMALLLSSCGLVSGDSCDPVGTAVDPVVMGEILDIGQSPRDSSDLLVVTRTPDGQFQAFRTVAGGALKRLPVSHVQEVAVASGPGYSMWIDEGAYTQQMRLEVDPSGAVTKMSVAESVLKLIGRDLPAGVAFQPSPRKFALAGHGVVEKGNTTVILVRPDVDWSYEEFRVFFGDGHLVERSPASVVSNGSLEASFKADGHEVKATVLDLMRGGVGPSPFLSIDGHLQRLLSYRAPYNSSGYIIACGQDVSPP